MLRRKKRIHDINVCMMNKNNPDIDRIKQFFSCRCALIVSEIDTQLLETTILYIFILRTITQE